MEQSHNDCVVVTDCQQLSSSGDNEMFAYPIPQWFVVVFIVASIFLIAVGVTGNALIIVVVVWYKKLRTVINVLIVNLAIKDVIALGVILPAQLWVFGREVYPFSMNLCVAFTAFSKTVIVGCMFDLTTIAVARYIYICRPRLRDRLFSSRLCLVCITIINWLIGLMFGIPILLRTPAFHPVFRQCMIGSNQHQRTFFQVACVGVPLLLISIFCYTKIFLKVGESKMNLARHQDTTNEQQQQTAEEGGTGSTSQKKDTEVEHVASGLEEEFGNIPSSGAAGDNKGKHNAVTAVKEFATSLRKQLKKKVDIIFDQSQLNKIRCEFCVFTFFFIFTTPYVIARAIESTESHFMTIQISTLFLVFFNNFFNSIIFGVKNRQISSAIVGLTGWNRWRAKRVDVSDVTTS